MSDHYEFGASCADTWRGCPGSINKAQALLSAGEIPEDKGSKYADEGSTAHDWADKCLKGDVAFDDIPTEFQEGLGGYIDLAEEIRFASDGGQVYTEQKVPLFYNTEKRGTLDYAVASATGVTILDLKWGQGVWVDANGHSQLPIYAKSLIDMLGLALADDAPIAMHIYQPRHRLFDGESTCWSMTYRELLDICIDIEADYRWAKTAGVDDLNPSEGACFFCKARAVCKARVMSLYEDIPNELNPMSPDCDPDSVIDLTPEATVAIHKNHRAIAKWMTEFLDNRAKLVEQGSISIPGMKLVQGKDGNRGWGSNEEDATKLLRKVPLADRFKPRRIISPAQAEKVLKKLGTPLSSQSKRFQNRFADLIYRKPGGTALVLDDDPRPALTPSVESYEDIVTEEDCI